MNLNTCEPAAAQSYPTFWIDDASVTDALVPVPDEDAYATFVSLCEDELPEDADLSTDPD